MEWSLPLLKNFIRRSVKAKTLYLYFCMYLYISPVVKKEYNFSTKNDTDFTLRLTSWILELGKLSNILTVQGITEIEKIQNWILWIQFSSSSLIKLRHSSYSIVLS